MKVMKFGGYCLKDAANILKIKNIVDSEKNQVLIVVSAIFNMTDLLFEAIQSSLDSEKNIPLLIHAIREKHLQILTDSVPSKFHVHKIFLNLDYRIRELEALLYSIAHTKKIDPTLQTMIISYGERLSALLLSGILSFHEIKSIAMDSDNIGLVTDHCYENATALLPEVKINLQKNVLPFFEAGYIPIITGFFGCTKDGKVTTFGRNGSDYSAAVIANAINAESLELWKNVDGFNSTDPSFLEGTQRIGTLSYDEAAELSYFGASIIHPRTVDPLIRKEIKLFIKNINDPNQMTLVQLNGERSFNIIKGVTYNTNIASIKLYGPGIGLTGGLVGTIGKTISDTEIRVFSVNTSQTSIDLLIEKNNSERLYNILSRSINNNIVNKIELDSDIALVAVVGDGLKSSNGTVTKILNAINQKRINVETISTGAGTTSSYIVIKKADLEPTIKAIHEIFFQESVPIVV